MIATSPLAASAFGYDTGVTGTVTVPAGCTVAMWSCIVAAGGAAGSVTITPHGPGQATGAFGASNGPPGAGGAIVVPAGATMGRDWPSGGPLGPATTLVFAGTASYYVEYAKGAAGG